jgi:DNA-directed RNA polymerase specialized sigma24 family protein
MILSWVNTIAINVHRRRSQYEARYEALSDLRGQVGIDLAAIDAARILALCRPRDRMLFEQRMGGLTTDEMAESQGVSPTAIRVRLLRARRVTRERVEKRAMALRLPVESGSALPL